MSSMKRIIVHWTAGTYIPNATDKSHYHYLIDGSGEVHPGTHKVTDNVNCTDGNYAAHTGGGNTGSIGIAMCGMAGFKSAKDTGKYPLTKIQCERCFKLIAELSKKYGIIINAKNVMTHYEFGILNPKTSSAGKIDIICLPPYKEVSQSEVGDFIRNKANWYYKNGG